MHNHWLSNKSLRENSVLETCRDMPDSPTSGTPAGNPAQDGGSPKISALPAPSVRSILALLDPHSNLNMEKLNTVVETKYRNQRDMETGTRKVLS